MHAFPRGWIDVFPRSLGLSLLVLDELCSFSRFGPFRVFPSEQNVQELRPSIFLLLLGKIQEDIGRKEPEALALVFQIHEITCTTTERKKE